MRAEEAFENVPRPGAPPRCRRCGTTVAPDERVNLQFRAFNYTTKKALASASATCCPTCGRETYDRIVGVLEAASPTPKDAA